MDRQESDLISKYRREVLNQQNPYLQWLRQQHDICEAKFKGEHNTGQGGFGEHICTLPFCSCMDRLYDVLEPCIKYDGAGFREEKSGRRDDDDIFVFYATNGFLDRYAVSEIKRLFENDLQCEFAYADEDYLSEPDEKFGDLQDEDVNRYIDEHMTLNPPDFRKAGSQKLLRSSPWFKPDFSPDTLRSFFYIGNIFALRYSLIKKTRKYLEGMTNAGDVNLYEFVCLAASLAVRVVHIDMALYTNRDDKAMDSLPGFEHEIKDSFMPQYALDRDDEPLISIIIPSRDNEALLKGCIESVVSKTDYPRLEFVVVDNGSGEEQKNEISLFLQKINNNEKNVINTQYIYEEQAFNFSKMCNMGARNANGEFLLFLNDDTEVLDGAESWLLKLSDKAKRAHVGAVGAKLLYPRKSLNINKEEDSYRIQHAGITNMAVGPVHKLCGMTDNGNIYHGRNIADYNVLAVTAACLMVSREKFESAGGFDEKLAVAYNDVDLCMRLAEKGLYNVVCNSSALIHHESFSRGEDISPQKSERLKREAYYLYGKHPGFKGFDPFYNRNLVQNRKDADYNVEYSYTYECVVMPEISEAAVANAAAIKWKQITENKSLILKFKNRLDGSALSMLAIDSVEQEDDIITIKGWHAMREKNNACYSKKLLLLRLKSDGNGNGNGNGNYNLNDNSNAIVNNNANFNDNANVDANNNTNDIEMDIDSDNEAVCYEAVIYPVLRADVDKLFKEDNAANPKRNPSLNTLLSGINVVISRSSLPAGSYVIGVATFGSDNASKKMRGHKKMIIHMERSIRLTIKD